MHRRISDQPFPAPITSGGETAERIKFSPVYTVNVRSICRYFFITMALFGVCGKPLHGQNVTIQAPPSVDSSPNSVAPLPVQLPESPSQVAYPTAKPVAATQDNDLVTFESSGPQTYTAGVYVLDRDVVITYKDRRVQADHVEYDSNTGDMTLTGHVLVTRTESQERISASHGTYNLKTETGKFYDVSGSYGIQMASSTHSRVYTTNNPFIFTGRVVVKTGPDVYDVYEGTVTSCQLPNPDWLISAAHISMADQKATAHNATFHLLNFPLLFLPYVTHPADESARDSGFLIPTFGDSTTKGIVVGEQFYLVLNRSMDLTVGADYYSEIGWAEMASFRYRGVGSDFVKAHYSGVVDRRAGAANQGGEEVIFAGRHDFSPETRVAATADYLSSYVYREAFSDNYNQAVTSDIVSTGYITHAWDGVDLSALVDRYQGIKVVGTATTTQQEVHIWHAPSISMASTDHVVPNTGNKFSPGLEVSLDSSAAGLKRTQPNFATGGIIERFDVHPQANYPIAVDDWHFVPTVGVRETYYTRSRATAVPGQPPLESLSGISRTNVDLSFAIRPPVVERTFEPTHLTRVFGTQLRHTIEPEVTYRFTDGVARFRNILRFDANDVVSNTNELEYGVTQRLFRRPAGKAGFTATASKPCPTNQVAQSPGFNSDAPYSSDDMPIAQDAEPEVTSGKCPSEELISWRLTQKYFFDQTFGGAIVNGRRNIFSTTLDLTGVAFLTEPRAISPLLSRLRIRSSAHTDVEWDFDFDTGALKFNSSNVYVDLHQGNSFAALSYARLDAPGRFFTENPTPTTGVASSSGVTSSVSDFNQLRVLMGYGSATKTGFSIAGNAGIDLKALYGATSTSSTGTATTVFPALLQYATVQAAYNWNCCGLAVEYRKFELGSVRNEGSYRFNFTLANIGAAGNLRRAERLF